MKKIKLAVVGATGMVGSTLLQVLEENKFPADEVYFFASAKSKGKKLQFNNKEYTVEELTETSFDRGIDIVLFSAGASTSKIYAPIAASKGCVVVDNSSAWRMDPEVPLVVPEVNPNDVEKHKGIIANPNCSTIQAVVALKPVHDLFGIKRVIFSTYQAVSGAGVAGYNDLKNGLEGQPPAKFPYPIANNCLPHIDDFLDNGYTKEEMKMVNETRKIMGLPNLKVTATTVRVPVFDCHSESINVECERPVDLDLLIKVLSESKGIVVQDDVKNKVYPMAISAKGKNEVFVGRIRKDESVENGINMWVVADNIRKGAATNTVQIAELLVHRM
ncbi:MAG TPA: aspartate-semialdehyde dehydrogenase [Clostridiales bacterium]|nr:aspartate-semialdehyde dehydrogenase [Clostridiales bacterium]